MAVFTDTVTIYNKISESEWKRTVVKGVQWSEKTDKKNVDGVLSVVRYVSITFPEGTYEGLTLNSYSEEDCIVYGEIEDIIDGAKGQRISDLMKKYRRSGIIQAVNDNSNRDFLKNIKVVIG